MGWFPQKKKKKYIYIYIYIYTHAHKEHIQLIQGSPLHSCVSPLINAQINCRYLLGWKFRGYLVDDFKQQFLVFKH